MGEHPDRLLSDIDHRSGVVSAVPVRPQNDGALNNPDISDGLLPADNESSIQPNHRLCNEKSTKLERVQRAVRR